MNTVDVTYHLLARCEETGRVFLECSVDDAREYVAKTGNRVQVSHKYYITSQSDDLTRRAQRHGKLSPEDMEKTKRFTKALKVTGQTYAHAVELVKKWDTGIVPEPLYEDVYPETDSK